MNTKDFLRLGVPLGEATRRATDFVAKYILGGGDKSRLHEEVAAIVANPSALVDDPLRGVFAKALLNAPPPPRAEPVKYRQWGEGLEHDAIMQMEKACLLPVSVAGALMPDAHVGYGLPIGGVLATDNAVIPYAVGVDIACRMKMTVLDIPMRDLEQKQDRLTRAIETETRFGVGANFKARRAHDVLDADWSVSLKTRVQAEAVQKVNAMNETERQPGISLGLAPGYLNATDPKLATRTWQEVMENIVAKKTDETRRRWDTAIKDRNFDCIRNLCVAETRPEHFDRALADGKVSSNVYLRRIHNHGLGMEWLLKSVIPRLQWPKPVFKTKRAITAEEHAAIVARELNLERRDFYELVWHT